MLTHHTLVRLLSRVDSHVNEQLVAGVKRLVTADAAGPEAGEVLSFALVDVDLLDVPHELLLLLVRSAAVDPATRLLVGQRSTSNLFPLQDHLRRGGAARGRFESQGRGRCCLLALVMQQAPWTLPHILVQVIRRGHRRERGVVVRVAKTPIATV